MFKRLASVICIVAMSAGLAGCSKCGFWLDEWMNRQSPASCKGDFPK